MQSAPADPVTLLHDMCELHIYIYIYNIYLYIYIYIYILCVRVAGEMVPMNCALSTYVGLSL